MRTVSLTWNSVTTDASGNPVAPSAVAGYRVERSDTGIDGPYSVRANTNPDPQYAESVDNGIYFYRVSTRNMSSEVGVPCAPVQVQVADVVPVLAAPTGLAASVF